MVQAWYMDDESGDRRSEHHTNPPEFVSLEELYEKTGVEYFQLNIDTLKTDGELERLKAKRGYVYEDEMIASREHMPDYDDRMKAFYTEHLHADEEIRLVLSGSGYFDLRDNRDRWVRVAISPGDLLVLPSGIYHRFTLDFNNYIHLKRLFAEFPHWQAHNRPADNLPCRQQYSELQATGFAQTC